MKISLVAAIAVIGFASFTASANEWKAQHSNRGRSGMVTTFVAGPARITVALSRQGQGVSSVSNRETTKSKPQWHNPSRPGISVPAH